MAIVLYNLLLHHAPFITFQKKLIVECKFVFQNVTGSVWYNNESLGYKCLEILDLSPFHVRNNIVICTQGTNDIFVKK